MGLVEIIIIRNHAIYYSKQKAIERNAREKLLHTTYEEAAKRYERDPSTINQNSMNGAKAILEHFYEEKMRGIIIRPRARWHEHGERSSKYFLNLEKRNNVRRHIRKLYVSGVITKDPYQILDEQRRFYNSLYESQSNDTNDKLSETFFFFFLIFFNLFIFIIFTEQTLTLLTVLILYLHPFTYTLHYSYLQFLNKQTGQTLTLLTILAI